MVADQYRKQQLPALQQPIIALPFHHLHSKDAMFCCGLLKDLTFSIGIRLHGVMIIEVISTEISKHGCSKR